MDKRNSYIINTIMKKLRNGMIEYGMNMIMIQHSNILKVDSEVLMITIM
jgi:hypothetical protein